MQKKSVYDTERAEATENKPVKVTRKQLEDYRLSVATSLRCINMSIEQAKEKMLRSSASKKSPEKKERDLRRLATLERSVTQLENVIQQVDVELKK